MDREKVVSVAMNGYATVGSTLIVPYSKYHWEPPADSLFILVVVVAAVLLLRHARDRVETE